MLTYNDLSYKIIAQKTCSCCGWINEDLTLADRIFVCQQCGLILDRDVNAARNLVQAAGEDGVPLVWRELTPLDIVSDLGNQATVVERGTEHCRL